MRYLSRCSFLSILIPLIFLSCKESTEPETVTEWIVYNTSNSGLPDDEVTSLCIDKNGNKWIGTDDGGLTKFDGNVWIVYNESNSGT
ncbi:MAG: two-component regulator propeller domain-containing protein [Candidatus Kariarchaeaceae archaeon]|jgi:ligand-binding sensor domain-containing protein